jgi:hypothetical protein
MADKNARIPCRTQSIKDHRGRILHWRAIVGDVEGVGDTEPLAVADLAQRIVDIVTGLESRVRFVRGEDFGTAVIQAEPSGWNYTMLHVEDGDGPANERIVARSACGGFATFVEAERATKSHAHSNLHAECMSCAMEHRRDDMQCWTTASGAAVAVCTVCVAGHGQEGAMRRAADGMPYPERNIEAWRAWAPSEPASVEG